MEKIERRKIVPVAAMIGAGKSKLLNVILNINFLENKEGISSKFVNILRYNPSINCPKFYHLKIKNENGKYIFYKDPIYNQKIGENVIIEENKKINKVLYNSTKMDYNDIFYMTEINSIGFIKDKNYMLKHDLCNIPGLSEYQEQNKIIKEEKEVLKEEDLEEKFEEGQEFEFVYTQKSIDNNSLISKKKYENRNEEEIFYDIGKKEESSYITEIYKRLKDYIDGAIIVLSIENYYFNQNIEIIAKLHKVVPKRIKNFLIILNKMDLSTDPKSDIDACKGFLLEFFPKFQTFNLNINNFIPISTLQIQNELLMNKSFNHLIKYHFYNYKRIILKEKLLNKPINKKAFIEHLKDILKGMQGITKKEIENKIDEINNRDDISKINEEIKSIIKDLNDNFNGEYGKGIKEVDIDKEDDDEDFLTALSSSRTFKTQDNIDDIETIMKMFYILQEKHLIIPCSTETEQLLNYFSIKNKEEEENEDKKVEKTLSNINLNNQIKDELKLFYEEFKTSCTNISQIQYLPNELQKHIKYLNIYDDAFIPFLGGSNVAESTTINESNGRDLLPFGQKETSKRENLLSTLNMLFMKESEKKEEQINYFKKEMNDLKEEIKSLIKNNVKYNLIIFKRFKADILCSLNKEMKNLEKLLDKIDYKEIVKQLYIIWKKNFENLVESIKQCLEKSDLKCLDIIKRAINVINSFKENKINSFIQYDFKSYMSNVFSDGLKSLNSEIMDEIKSELGLSAVYNKKGIKEWVYSFLDSHIYLFNIIDMTSGTYISKIESFLKMIENESNKYLKQLIEKIDNYAVSTIKEFNNIQKKRWIELYSKYEKTKSKIK